MYIYLIDFFSVKIHKKQARILVKVQILRCYRDYAHILLDFILQLCISYDNINL